MKILILGGGDSPEREVSLRSAGSVAKAAQQAGFEVLEADPKFELGILDKIPERTIVFPILHGVNGEDGFIQRELEKRKLPFLGSGSESSAACFDKWRTREKLEAAGIPMPKAALVTQEDYARHPLSQKPHVIKVLRGGSSIGTLIVRTPESVQTPAADSIFNSASNALLEELIEGKEVTVPILDGKALPVIEIVPPQDEEFDYENKYNGRTQEIVPAKSVPEDLQAKAAELSENVHKTMDARHLSRVDIMIDNNNKLYVLEVNTIPGLTDQSLYPKSAAVAGLDMSALAKRFAELVKRDYKL